MERPLLLRRGILPCIRESDLNDVGMIQALASITLGMRRATMAEDSAGIEHWTAVARMMGLRVPRIRGMGA